MSEAILAMRVLKVSQIASIEWDGKVWPASCLVWIKGWYSVFISQSGICLILGSLANVEAQF